MGSLEPTGVDALPFDYMMDEVVEAKKFDPDGNYVRRWLPALARLPLKWIHKSAPAPSLLFSRPHSG